MTVTEPDVAEPVVTASLSPSRASDFMTCPLLYRFRTIDRLPEAPSREATRGTVVHSVLERLFELPAGERSLERATTLVEPAWADLLADEPELGELFASPAELAEWLASARDLVGSYFDLEDPRRLEPAALESLVEVVLPTGLRLRGYVDRLDRAATGAVRVVDYKTGKCPDPLFEARALFQMKFYALVIWRTEGVIPSVLQLMYLADRTVLKYSPHQEELEATERKLEALRAAIDRSLERGEFRPNRGRLCDWCSHQAICPAWGGTPPPMPSAVAEVAVPEVLDLVTL